MTTTSSSNAVSTTPHVIDDTKASSVIGEENMQTRDLGVFVLPAPLSEEAVAEDDTRVNSEGYTSKIYQCCY
jgi:hypothetical protein